jgi:hypothetical protein
MLNIIIYDEHNEQEYCRPITSNAFFRFQMIFLATKLP